MGASIGSVRVTENCTAAEERGGQTDSKPVTGTPEYREERKLLSVRLNDKTS